MRKLRIMQFWLFLTTVVATVLFVCVPFDIVSLLQAVLYFLLAIVPQIIAIIFQLKIVKYTIIRHKKAFVDYFAHLFEKEKRDVRHPSEFAEALHTVAKLKSMGIHPNRAGPVGVFA